MRALPGKNTELIDRLRTHYESRTTPGLVQPDESVLQLGHMVLSSLSDGLLTFC